MEGIKNFFGRFGMEILYIYVWYGCEAFANEVLHINLMIWRWENKVFARTSTSKTPCSLLSLSLSFVFNTQLPLSTHLLCEVKRPDNMQVFKHTHIYYPNTTCVEIRAG